MPCFAYGQTEVDFLAAADPILGAAMRRIGPIDREIFPEPFAALLKSVVGQQISLAAARTVWGRLTTALGEIRPENLLSLPEEALRGCGLSGRKVAYLRGIAQAAHNGAVDFAALRELPDAEVIRRLTALPGVGVWTAEMLLIFSLCRPDVVSYGDLMIRAGMMRLYGLDSLPRAVFDERRARYHPHGTVASLYLWHISHET